VTLVFQQVVTAVLELLIQLQVQHYFIQAVAVVWVAIELLAVELLAQVVHQ
jgi:hypothetical protein